jgi:hypothetical protein
MESEQPALALDPSDAHCWVSERFLSSLFSALSKRGLSPTALLGDLPIAVDESGRVLDPVHWDHVCELMRRLEHHAGGTEGLELCGESLCERSATPRLSRSSSPLRRATGCGSTCGSPRRSVPARNSFIS